MQKRLQFFLFGCLFVIVACHGRAAELVELTDKNWDAFSPDGKEVDAIYGDYVLRSNRLIAVIGQAVPTRHANMKVKNVGGALIDFTRRDVQSDQLSCFYPHGQIFEFVGPITWPEELKRTIGAAVIAFRAKPVKKIGMIDASNLEVIVGYELADDVDYLVVRSLISNPREKPIEFELADAICADGEFKFGFEPQLNLWWCHDEFWKQAYGLQPTDHNIVSQASGRDRRGPSRILYHTATGKEKHVIPPKSSLVFERRFFPGADTLTTQAIARRLRGEELFPINLKITDPAGPVVGAMIRIKIGDNTIGSGRSDEAGLLATALPPGAHSGQVTAHGRKKKLFEVSVSSEQPEVVVRLQSPGYIEGKVVDESGQRIPCKVAFHGQNVADPNFGPDSAIHGVRNLWYTHDGRLRVELLPGRYDVLISRGPEYDAVLETLDVVAGETTRFEATLERSVNTTGWLSAEMHSHSSPSGDNTASQRGRVLNLLAEHLEFIPCTEHQRISSYEPHLKHFASEHRVLSCPGMELTGSPLALNHQNAFPLVLRERTQDGGAPQTDPHPEVQIARLAMWDDAIEKVVQINHPNIAQMVGDRDLDGVPDEGFRKMFYYADIIEVHPLQMIFEDLTVGEGGPRDRGNAIVNWMQLLNLGYRIPGVVNTDAHWNFHGSGWSRNYVRSSTDDPAEADLMEICRALERGQIVMTTGPFMEVVASAGGKSVGPGEDLSAIEGQVLLSVRVECPNWLNINRVQVFVNGRPRDSLNFTQRTHNRMFGDDTIKFQNTIEVELVEDAHIIVAAVEVGGQLGRVFGPSQGKTLPIAVTNPIFIDIDGNGFSPNGDMLGQPLPVESDHQPTHGHDRRPPHAH